MKLLVAEDDTASNLFLAQFLSQYGEVDRVVDGLETLEAYSLAMQENKPYDIIFLDIMMPKLDGVKALKAIRDYEAKKKVKGNQRVKVILTTALDETDYTKRAFDIGCEGCLGKPIDTQAINKLLLQLGVIQ
ncbi:response regulator with CheY-like receiver domain and winged-helix DNA-binding domain [Desulfitobacterium dichloroeliminans LMG P-21439]|uniref:Stage 0 sporulation protein A homolog n=1 Tax=Desulfitobacterium dichloroeliminans (strain LMG P-21439 / DCA1) TaxID=871963 RepID=L0FA33_DESDL|nr:response regulator [Desulfitobacterium dichloroeliminans]AGA70674.1 response regulator with CheY-like receiver domain and winged-helix DNA-binding domain [Desulfitobacterium dichloroeliminans LMG P-21439]